MTSTALQLPTAFDSSKTLRSDRHPWQSFSPTQARRVELVDQAHLYKERIVRNFHAVAWHMNALGLREAFAAAGYEVPGNPRSLPKDFEDSGTPPR